MDNKSVQPANYSLDEFFERHHNYLAGIENQMLDVLKRRGKIAPLFDEMASHHLGWDPNGNSINRGKRIRPLLTLLVAEALEGNKQAAYAVGGAIELMHNFTLVHDDIMDKSLERRHRPTVWSIWGIGQGINTGDGLYALAHLSILDLRTLPGISSETVNLVFEEITNACLDIVEGQILDLSFENRQEVTVDEYIKMVSGKTAALFACASVCGAIVSTSDVNIRSAYRKFGLNLGIAFQIVDDYLGIWGKESDTGKPSGKDIAERKKSLPILWALEKADQADVKKLRGFYAKKSLNDTDVSQIFEILNKVNAGEYTNKVATEYYKNAIDALEAVNIQNAFQNEIKTFSSFFVDRKK